MAANIPVITNIRVTGHHHNDILHGEWGSRSPYNALTWVEPSERTHVRIVHPRTGEQFFML